MSEGEGGRLAGAGMGTREEGKRTMGGRRAGRNKSHGWREGGGRGRGIKGRKGGCKRDLKMKGRRSIWKRNRDGRRGG